MRNSRFAIPQQQQPHSIGDGVDDDYGGGFGGSSDNNSGYTIQIMCSIKSLNRQ